jgi:hypothetical protein
MSKPPVNEQGTPVRRGAYDYETRGGKLQDVNRDNQVSFADTWIGDMLGMDGQGGVQGPSMRDSMGGARRKAIEMMQSQGVPMTQANLARAMGGAGGANAGGGPASDIAQPGTVMHEDQPVTTQTIDDEGNLVPLAAAATGAAAGAYAAKRMLGGKPIEVGEDGKLKLPAPANRSDVAQIEPLRNMTPQQAAEAGWSVVGINYPDGGNALPAPSRIDMIDGTTEDVTDVNRSAAGPQGGGANAGGPAGAAPNGAGAGPVAGDAATRPISTEELMQSGVGNGTAVGTVGGDNTRFVDTGQISHGGEPVFSDNVNGGFVTRGPDGNVVHAATMEALKAAIRAAIR